MNVECLLSNMMRQMAVSCLGVGSQFQIETETPVAYQSTYESQVGLCVKQHMTGKTQIPILDRGKPWKFPSTLQARVSDRPTSFLLYHFRRSALSGCIGHCPHLVLSQSAQAIQYNDNLLPSLQSPDLRHFRENPSSIAATGMTA